MGLREKAAELYRPAMQVPFTLQEYESRVAKVRDLMEKNKIDLLYCSSPVSLFYLTGYQNMWYQAESPLDWPPLSGLAIRRDADKIIFFDRPREEIITRTYTLGADIRIRTFEMESQISELEFIVKTLKAEGWLKGTVGLEKLSHRPNPAISHIFQNALEKEGCRVVNGSDIVRKIRAVKSSQEMAYTGIAARIADIGMKAAIDCIEPGMTELDVRAEILYAVTKAGGEVTGLPIQVMAGTRTACGHAMATRNVIMPQDMIYIDICGVYNRYHCNTMRMVSVGKPHPEVAKQMELSVGAWEVLMKALKPNLTIGELNKTMRAYYEEVGIWEDRRWVGGYELGIAFPPDWIGVWQYEAENDTDDRVICAGTVFNYESQIYLPQGAGLSNVIDTIETDENRCKIMSELSPDLIIVEK
jgi:Xaa-Pro aminopeptidase